MEPFVFAITEEYTEIVPNSTQVKKMKNVDEFYLAEFVIINL